MKKITILIACLGLTALTQNCSKTIDPDTGCVITADGTLRELPTSCFSSTITAANNFSFHLDSVNLAAGQTLEIIAKATTVAETSGWKFAFTGGSAGKVRVSKLGTSQAMDSAAYDTTDSKTWCFDIHGDEDPHHIVFWKGTCSTSIVAGQWGNAQFNSNDQSASAGNYAARASTNYGTGMATCAPGSCFAAGSLPTGTKILYKADKLTTTAITVKAPRTSGL